MLRAKTNSQRRVIPIMINITESIERPTERFEVFHQMAINCGRTIKRFVRTLTTLAKKPNESIAAASADAAEAKAIYRLLFKSQKH